MDRFTWGIVGGVLGLVLLSIVVAVALPGRPAPPDEGTPGGVVLAYALALQERDGERAWQYLARSYQATIRKQPFLEQVAGGFGSNERARLSVGEPQGEGDSTRVDLVRTYPSGGPFGLGGSGSQRQTVSLVREDGVWRISVPPDPWMFRTFRD